MQIRGYEKWDKRRVNRGFMTYILVGMIDATLE